MKNKNKTNHKKIITPSNQLKHEKRKRKRKKKKKSESPRDLVLTTIAKSASFCYLRDS